MERLSEGETTEPFAYVDKRSMSTIGGNKAITRLKGHDFHGFWALLLWLFVHLLYIIGVRNKFLVITNWAWNYLTNERPLRSIIRVKTGKEDNCGKA